MKQGKALGIILMAGAEQRKGGESPIVGSIQADTEHPPERDVARGLE